MLKKKEVWNYHRAKIKNFVSNAKTIMSSCNHKMLILLETRIPNIRGRDILKKLGFNKWELVRDEQNNVTHLSSTETNTKIFLRSI